MNGKKNFVINNKVIMGYVQCPRKGFLLAFDLDQGDPHGYEQIIAEQRLENIQNYFNSPKVNGGALKLFTSKAFYKGEKYLKEALLQHQDLEAHSDLLTNVLDGVGLKINYEPTVFSGLYKISDDDKVKLACIGHVLGLIQDKPPKIGSIISLDQGVRKVNLEKHYKVIKRAIQTLRQWNTELPSEEPQIVIKKHCSICQFQKQCLAKAENDDNLSLLDRITPKILAKYHKKGVFTIKQLSFLFRQRRVRKKRKNAPLRFSPELQAMAIRTGKIYIQAPPKLNRQGTELYLDIEGVPDQDFHYLFGVLVVYQGQQEYFSFWANIKSDEKTAWTDLLKLLDQYPNAPIYHYGSYEIRAFDELAKRYNSNLSAAATERFVNINSLVFGKIYFPVRSNGLKAIGKFIGATWTEQDASGLQSLVWRYQWDQFQSTEDMNRLVVYNKDDCIALNTLVETISLADLPNADAKKFDFADNPKRDTSEIGDQIHRHFELLLKSAWETHDKNKISLRRSKDASAIDLDKPKRKRGGVIGHKGVARIAPKKAGRIINLLPRRHCPLHKREKLVASVKVANKTIIDLHFSKNGCRKITTRYIGNQAYCSKCNRLYNPPELDQFGGSSGAIMFGHSFRVWVIYQRVILRLPYFTIKQTINDLFGETISEGSVANFMIYLATRYEPTRKKIEEMILKSPFIHADETKINIQGVNHYVWVFTDGQHVLFKMTETRESDLVHEFLVNYDGVLVSDFFPGYDAVKCKQQKCWVHLIRDLNEDLWNEPYNTELEKFVLQINKLIEPIFQTIDKHGLKKRNLNKFKSKVDQFYEQHIVSREYKSEVTIKYQKRFQKQRDALFTFLTMDSIPWNNNMAERAIRHLAVQRKISGSFYKNAAPHYLLLLGIAQTCRFQEKSFLKFLLSGEIDIIAFKAGK